MGQLRLKNALQISAVLKIPQGQLGGQLVCVSGVTGHQVGLHGLLAVVAVIGVGGVEVGEALLQIGVKQGLNLCVVE